MSFGVDLRLLRSTTDSTQGKWKEERYGLNNERLVCSPAVRPREYAIVQFPFMMPIKLQCGCGQKYAFDVEPVNGQIATAVACPICGADGTAAANQVIAQTLATQPEVAPTSGLRLSAAAAPAAPVARPTVSPPGTSRLAVRPPKKTGLFSKIENKEDALKVAKDSAGGFFVVAVIQGGIGAFLAPSMLIDAAIFAILAAILRSWKSRVAAILLLLMSLGMAVTTTLTRLRIIQAGGSNIFLALIVLWAGIRAVQATFLLHGRFAASKDRVR